MTDIVGYSLYWYAAAMGVGTIPDTRKGRGVVYVHQSAWTWLNKGPSGHWRAILLHFDAPTVRFHGEVQGEELAPS